MLRHPLNGPLVDPTKIREARVAARAFVETLTPSGKDHLREIMETVEGGSISLTLLNALYTETAEAANS